MEQDSKRPLLLHVNSAEEAVPEPNDEDLRDLIIQKIESVVSSTEIDTTTKTQIISYYVMAKYHAFSQTGYVEEIEDAIEKQRVVLDLAKWDNQSLSEELDLLGILLTARYERVGEESDLENAIEMVEKAVRLTPTDHPDLAGYLNNLGNKLERRYERTGEMADLQMAIEKAEQAVKATPANYPNLAMYLNNLGNKLESRYERTGEMADLQMAIETAEQAVKAIPANHPNLAIYLNNLGTKLESRYERTGEMADLQIAIEKAEQAVKATPAHHPNLAARLNNLGNKLESRYERTGEMADLQMAIEKAKQAVKATPANYLNLAAILNNLGQRQLLANNPMRIDNALSSFLRAWHSDAAIPSHRLQAAIAAVDLLANGKRWSEAADLAIEAVQLLPLMNRRTLSRDDQQQVMSTFAGLAAKACSLTLESGRPVEKAVEILEQGRGAILGLITDDRRDVSYLYQSCPKEAQEYERLRAEMNTTPSDAPAVSMREQTWKRRAIANQELEQCIERIRRLPGFDRFLLGASAHELQQQASTGPIIVVNVTNIRSDAIVIQPHQIQSIRLPSFFAKDLRSWNRQKLTEFDKATFGKKNKKYREYLCWVWTSCVQPIVHYLSPISLQSPYAHPSLHVWWIGAGDASNVPFHAAGDHSLDSVDNTISHMVSSYTPTIKALGLARERIVQGQRALTVDGDHDTPRTLCAVTMPHTPGASSLSGVIDELANIRTAAASTFTIAHLASPTAVDVKDQLQRCHVFHFAGHGKADVVDPSRGCLVLQKLDESGHVLVQDPLSVDDVSRLLLPHAQLAYLSACSTAENNSSLLADEVIHLVSGLQVAGFPHVVGSMWPSVDQICADMARRFYQRVCKVDKAILGDDLVARALHGAVREVRRQWWTEPLAWAQYVHFGG